MKRFLLFASCLFTLTSWSQNDLPAKLKDATPSCFIKPEPTIRIRCGGTLSKSTPLIVVDGIPLDKKQLSDIDPQQIKSITVLKGSEASALFGSRALDGVIVINLKQVKNIRLKIVDASDSLPLSYATVKLYNEDQGRNLVSNDQGEVVLPSLLKDKEYKVEVTSIGYTAVVHQSVFNNDKQTLIIPLKKNFKKLEEVVLSCNSYRTIRCRWCGMRVTRIHNHLLNNKPESKTTFSVFPNPLAKGQLLTVLPKTVCDYYQLFSITGQMIQSGKINVGKEQAFQINTSTLTGGAYFIRLIDKVSGTQSTEKVVIQ